MELERLPLLQRLIVLARTCFSRNLGRAGELAAACFLRWKGLYIVGMNWRSRSGELDLIAVTEKNELVFVEVKTTLKDAPSAWSRIDVAKEGYLVRTAQDYARVNALSATDPFRFDVVLVLGEPRKLRGKLRFLWARKVF